MTHRKGERPRTHFRSERVQQANGIWFLLTRESIQEGPFHTHREVMMALERHTAVWTCKLFSTREFDRINSLSLQTEVIHQPGTAANASVHHRVPAKAQQR